MTTRTSLACLILGSITIAGTQRGDVAAARTVAGSDGAASQVVLRINKKDSLTRGHLAQLRRGSAMARELLVRVANLPDTILMICADPALVSKAGLYGRSRFWVNTGNLFGYIQYQAGPLNSWGTQCLIVHELAHAVEIATAGRSAGTAAIRDFVLSRAIGLNPAAWGAETEFPQQVALAVLAELQGKPEQEDTLERIALAHRITFPPATPTNGVLASRRH